MFRKLIASPAIAGMGLVFAADNLIAQSDLAAVVKERKDLMKSMGASFKPLCYSLQGPQRVK
jgi:hypothetical protein